MINNDKFKDDLKKWLRKEFTIDFSSCIIDAVIKINSFKNVKLISRKENAWPTADIELFNAFCNKFRHEINYDYMIYYFNEKINYAHEIYNILNNDLIKEEEKL